MHTNTIRHGVYQFLAIPASLITRNLLQIYGCTFVVGSVLAWLPPALTAIMPRPLDVVLRTAARVEVVVSQHLVCQAMS